MICRNVHIFRMIRTLVIVGFFPIGLVTSTAIPALGSSNSWTATDSMTTARTGHTATLLANGEVLVAGGLSNGSAPWAPSCTASVEFYNPSTGQWTTTGSMTRPRDSHTATLLTDGSVLVAGGLCNGGFTYPDSSAELYDPSTGTWTATGSMNVARVNTAATLLPNGQVLIAGGNSTSSGGRSAELYDHGHWTLTGSMNVYRPNLTATLLPNGDVLVFGGTQLASSASEFYTPATGTWTSTGQFGVAPSRIGHTLTLLGTGRALIAGGRNKYSITSYSRLYDWSTNSWPFTSAGNMSNVREFHTATLLPNGQVLVAGGYFVSNNTVTQLASAELYTP